MSYVTLYGILYLSYSFIMPTEWGFKSLSPVFQNWPERIVLTDKLLLQIDDKIEDAVSGYRQGGQDSFRYFLRDFIPYLCDKCGYEDLAEIDPGAAEKVLSEYSSDRLHKPSTVRTYKFGLKSFIRACDIEIAPYDLATHAWEGRAVYISEPDFRLFLDVIDEQEKEELAQDLKLICCLAYYCGLTLNESMKLTNSSFLRTKSGYIVHVSAVSSKSKERYVEVPKAMENELVSVISRGRNPLFSFKKNAGHESDSFAAKKRKIQRLVQKAATTANNKRVAGYDLKYDLKSFRTSRICADLYSGMKNCDIMKKYGVGNDYLFRISAI